MSTRARRLGGALSLLALLALAAAAVASATSPPAPVGPAKPGKIRNVGQSSPSAPTTAGQVRPIGYRLSAQLAPAASTSQAAGRWDGVLVHTIGTVRNGAMPSIPGCSVSAPKVGGPGQAPPRQSGLPHQIKCGNKAVPPFAVPAHGNHWILGWKLTYSNLSSAVTGADLKVTVAAGAAPIAPTALCSTACVSGKFGRTLVTDDQAQAILKGDGSIVVSTTGSPAGEISGPIVKIAAPAAPKTVTGR